MQCSLIQRFVARQHGVRIHRARARYPLHVVIAQTDNQDARRSMINFKAYDFHPAILFPGDDTPPVVDLTADYDRDRLRTLTWAIGRYDEVRTQAMYSAPQYDSERRVHMGIDIWAPAGTPVYACYDGIVAACTHHNEPGNYGGTIITRHKPGDTPFWVLYGHLSAESAARYKEGASICAGSVLGALGDMHENGGWVPHLHFQVALHPPTEGDYPGVVRPQDRDAARQRYPDPRHILGPLYRETEQ